MPPPPSILLWCGVFFVPGLFMGLPAEPESVVLSAATSTLWQLLRGWLDITSSSRSSLSLEMRKRSSMILSASCVNCISLLLSQWRTKLCCPPAPAAELSLPPPLPAEAGAAIDGTSGMSLRALIVAARWKWRPGEMPVLWKP